MTITQSLLNTVLEEAGDRRVTHVHLRVGEMSCIVPHQVEIFFKYLSRGSSAEAARLNFENLPLEITCLDCQKTCDLSAWQGEQPRQVMCNAFARGCECGSRNLRVTGGIGFELSGLEIE